LKEPKEDGKLAEVTVQMDRDTDIDTLVSCKVHALWLPKHLPAGSAYPALILSSIARTDSKSFK